MALRARKLLIVQEQDPTIASSPVSHSVISSNTLSPIVRTKNNEDYYVSSSYGGLSGYRLNPPFDASMALTVLVLLIAVFLMGFFSFYIRRFANDSSVDQSRRFRRRFASSISSYAASVGSASPKGVDPDTVDSLPVYSYRETAKQEIDCTICLSEFEEGEVVKVIPFCGHVFHVDCIETWLSSHVTCPLCRTAKLFPAKEAPAPEEVRVVIRCGAGGARTVGGSGSTVDERDTWNACVGPDRLRRSSSCLLSGERVVVLRRSLSF